MPARSLRRCLAAVLRCTVFLSLEMLPRLFGQDLKPISFGRFCVVLWFRVGELIMSDQVSLNVDVRTEAGKKVAKKLRFRGQLPAVVYGEGAESVACSVDQRRLTDLLKAHGRNAIISLSAGDTSQSTIIKDIQYHPVRDEILHVDFHRIDLTRKIVVEVPLHATGSAVGVRIGEGILEQMLHDLEVECLPTEIPDHIEIDVSDLDIGDSLHVSDIVVDGDDFSIVTDSDRTIFAVAAPSLVIEEEEEEEDEEGLVAEGEEGAEGEEMQEPELIERGRRSRDDEEGDES
ncbi:MAG: 50S ribosomal protein L25 [Gemmatimonadetes bacterium]|nr:50S ribosomal protein L25 [Gemmatimonadota bacterium]